MFGYVTVNKPELKLREYEKYHSYYCGLCHTLRERSGIAGQFTLTYDTTFLVILLSSLYEPKTRMSKSRCIAHPGKKHLLRQNKITAYGADMNIALTFHKCLDDWKDDKSLSGISGMNLLYHQYCRVHRIYPDKCTSIEKYLQQLSACEARNEQNPDKTAGIFGRLMACLFDYQQDIWSPYLKRFGFYLGKFIYIMDAYLDFEEDRKKGHYNPLNGLFSAMSRSDFDKACHSMLELMIADACQQFEKLPLDEDIELMRNILYAGIWTKYDKYRAQAVHKRQPDATQTKMTHFEKERD